MKLLRITSLFSLFFMTMLNARDLIVPRADAPYDERFIVAVVTGYNNAQWYERNLRSIFQQEYTNYHVIYWDDASTDGTFDLVSAYVKQAEKREHVTLMHNDIRKGCGLANQYEAIHMTCDGAIIVIVDADDALAHPHVFAYLNRIYSDESVWMTYGQFIEWPTNGMGFCTPMPQAVVQHNTFRSHPHIPSHLRTFYAKLFKMIRKEDLMYEGRFFRMSGDMGTMIPMIEMARNGHFRFIPDVLYAYNTQNALSDHRVSKSLQRTIDLYIRSLPPYAALENLF